MAQRTELLMANEMDRCTENQGRTTACSISSMPECDGKGQGEDRMAQSKRARGGSLAIVDGPQLSGANLYPPGVWFADATSSFSGVTFVFVLLRFVYAFTEAAALSSIVLRSSICMRPNSNTCFFFFSSSFFGEDVAFSEYFCTVTVCLCMRLRRTFSPPGWCFSSL